MGMNIIGNGRVVQNLHFDGNSSRQSTKEDGGTRVAATRNLQFPDLKRNLANDLFR